MTLTFLKTCVWDLIKEDANLFFKLGAFCCSTVFFFESRYFQSITFSWSPEFLALIIYTLVRIYHEKQAQWKVRITLLKSKSCFWNYNTLFLRETFTISSKKDSKYEVLFLNWSLAIVITESVPFRVVS